LARRYSKVRVTMVEKRGECHMDVGHSFVYETPWRQPEGMCGGLAHPLAYVVMACSLGGESWEEDDPERFYISCVSKKGTVWRVEREDE